MLLLFDIDGTLLRGATDAHRDALHEALRQVHGIDAHGLGRHLSPAGRTDPEIARALLLEAGVSARRIDDRAGAVRQACCRIYARLCPPDLSHTIVPGVGEVLARLSEREEHKLALVSGNYEPVARLKLSRAGIGRYFSPREGAFGSDAEDRAALPAIARRRAGTRGRPYPRENTIVIGDTPRDIACAHVDGVRCIAVTTGPFARDALSDADVVVDDADELAEALATWASGTAPAS